MRSTFKTGLVVIAAACMVVAFATPAFAVWGDGGYMDWATVAGLPGQGTSPHGGYSTTTAKCGVCHAVHSASAAGDMLLPSPVNDACTYCHVDTLSSYTQVYNSDPNNYNVADLPNAHNSYQVLGVEQGVLCSQCHQVHAADSQMTSNAYLTTKLLRGGKTYTAGTPNYDVVAREPKSTDTSNTALTKWCTSCHPASLGGYTYYGGGYNGQSHVMTTATANFQAANPSSTYAGRVAWINSNQCSSCHASGFGTAAWPHFTSGNRFLVVADGATGTVNPATNTEADGVCIRCHRQGLNGVGKDF